MNTFKLNVELQTRNLLKMTSKELQKNNFSFYRLSINYKYFINDRLSMILYIQSKEIPLYPT
jgi:hypothetical protein